MPKSVRLKSITGSCFLFLSFVFLSQACSNAVEYLSYTRKEPLKTDLVGTWVPDISTLASMRHKYDPSVKTSLVLRGNGTFDLINMPDWWSDFGNSNGGFKSSSGTWAVFQNTTTEFWELGLGTTSVQMLDQKAPYRLSFIIGDADGDQRMIFAKQ